MTAEKLRYTPHYQDGAEEYRKPGDDPAAGNRELVEAYRSGNAEPEASFGIQQDSGRGRANYRSYADNTGEGWPRASSSASDAAEVYADQAVALCDDAEQARRQLEGRPGPARRCRTPPWPTRRATAWRPTRRSPA